MSGGPLEATAGKASVANLEAAGEDIDRAVSVLPVRMTAVINAMNGHPPGRGFDSVGGRASVSFCEPHGREHCPCGGGTTYAARSDPTGEAASRPDRAKQDHDRVVALAKSIRKQADELVGILARYGARSATDTERHSTGTPEDGGCWSCSRTHVSKGVARFEPAEKRPTVDGERRPLCSWCYDWLRQVGSLPPVAQVEQHHRGIRVRRPA